MAAAFVHVLIPQTGRVELVHPATAEARGWEVVAADTVVTAPVDDERDDDERDDDPQTSETAAPQSDSATE
jgi:hypothetical protein